MAEGEHYYEINTALSLIDSDLQDFLDDIHSRIKAIEQTLANGDLKCRPYGVLQDLSAKLEDLSRTMGYMRYNR